MAIINKIGLEAEFLLRNSEDKALVFPGDYGFYTDEYIILGEFRGDPGETIHDTLASFMKEYYKVKEKVEFRKKILDLSGYAEIDNDFSAKIMRKMGSKRINDSANIYGTDILKLSDAVIKHGEVVGRKISCGLHIHFSSDVRDKKSFTIKEHDNFSPITIPITMGESGNKVETEISLWKKLPDKSKDNVVYAEAIASQLNNPTREYIIKYFDENILPKYVSKNKMPQLKFRNPGFYEVKPWGFEYRSLPFNDETMKDLYYIVEESFKILKSL